MFKIVCVIFAAVAVASSSASNREGRIVGGEAVPYNQAQFMASVQYFGVHIASGVIVGMRWILTGAFSVVNCEVSSLAALLGSKLHNFAGPFSQNITVDKVIINPQFNNITRQNDIACLRLSHDITRNNFVLYTELPYVWIGPNFEATVYGWGAVDSNMGDSSSFLKQLNVTTVGCPSTPDGDRVPDDQINICARGLSETGFCTTDIGGPLISNFLVIGIASWHPTQCAPVNDPPTTEGYPDVYVRTHAFLEWINHATYGLN